MSLINDALKRIGQKQTPAEPPPTTGLKPVEEGGGGAGGPVKVLVVVLAVAALGVGGWFTWKALHPPKPKSLAAAQPGKKTGVVERAKRPARPKGTGELAKVTGQVQSNLPPVAPSNPPAPAVAAPAPTPPAEAATPAQPTVAPAAEPAPVAKAEPTVAAPATPPAPVVWPKLDLQGVFFHPKSPSARINGTNLYVGGEIEGVRVVEIQRQSVSVQLGGETNVLTLGQ